MQGHFSVAVVVMGVVVLCYVHLISRYVWPRTQICGTFSAVNIQCLPRAQSFPLSNHVRERELVETV